jgi:hypothetical protein
MGDRDEYEELTRRSAKRLGITGRGADGLRKPQYITVLEIPPVNSPESTVKVAIAAKATNHTKSHLTNINRRVVAAPLRGACARRTAPWLQQLGIYEMACKIKQWIRLL